jgi:hypothetical protein
MHGAIAEGCEFQGDNFRFIRLTASRINHPTAFLVLASLAGVCRVTDKMPGHGFLVVNDTVHGV